MSRTIDPRITDLLAHLAAELPALIDSGETWAVEINGTKDGKIFRMIKRSTQIAPGPNERRLIAK